METALNGRQTQGNCSALEESVLNSPDTQKNKETHGQPGKAVKSRQNSTVKGQCTGWGRIAMKEETRNIAQGCRGAVREAKVQMKLILAKYIKGIKKRFTSTLVVEG